MALQQAPESAAPTSSSTTSAPPVGADNAAELATYVVEKGKTLVEVIQ